MEAKARIASLVQAAPGSSTRMVAAGAGVDDSTADYHLRRLRKEGKVVRQRHGREVCWFAARGAPCPVVRRLVPAFRKPETRAVALALGDAPQSSVALAAAAGAPKGRARWAARALVGLGIATRTDKGLVVLAEGARTCVAKGLAAEACDLWGACPVSRNRPADAPARP